MRIALTLLLSLGLVAVVPPAAALKVNCIVYSLDPSDPYVAWYKAADCAGGTCPPNCPKTCLVVSGSDVYLDRSCLEALP